MIGDARGKNKNDLTKDFDLNLPFQGQYINNGSHFKTVMKLSEKLSGLCGTRQYPHQCNIEKARFTLKFSAAVKLNVNKPYVHYLQEI